MRLRGTASLSEVERTAIDAAKRTAKTFNMKAPEVGAPSVVLCVWTGRGVGWGGVDVWHRVRHCKALYCVPASRPWLGKACTPPGAVGSPPGLSCRRPPAHKHTHGECAPSPSLLHPVAPLLRPHSFPGPPPSPPPPKTRPPCLPRHAHAHPIPGHQVIAIAYEHDPRDAHLPTVAEQRGGGMASPAYGYPSPSSSAAQQQQQQQGGERGGRRHLGCHCAASLHAARGWWRLRCWARRWCLSHTTPHCTQRTPASICLACHRPLPATQPAS